MLKTEINYEGINRHKKPEQKNEEGKLDEANSDFTKKYSYKGLVAKGSDWLKKQEKLITNGFDMASDKMVEFRGSVEPLEIKVRKIKKTAELPTRAHEKDAGMDLYSCSQLSLLPGERTTILTGIQIKIPEGYYGRICDRSGLAAKQGAHVLAGVVDSPYRGEIMVVLLNTGKSPIQINIKDRIAQMVIEKHYNFPVIGVDELDVTNRGENGMGSTGR